MNSELVDLDITTMCAGSVIEEANKAIREVLGHCERHIAIKKPRSVLVEIHFEPDIHEETQEFAVNITHCSVAKLPKTYGKSDRAAKRGDTYKVVSSNHMMPLEAKQMSLAEADTQSVEHANVEPFTRASNQQ